MYISNRNSNKGMYVWIEEEGAQSRGVAAGRACANVEKKVADGNVKKAQVDLKQVDLDGSAQLRAKLAKGCVCVCVCVCDYQLHLGVLLT